MNISILGCGWLGLPLAEHLLQRGHTIKGSTTSPEKLGLLQTKGINPFLINLTPNLEAPVEIKSFWRSDMLILNIPPGRRGDDVITYHTRQIQSVKKAVEASSIKLVVFISSTSVYPKFPGIVDETDATPGKAGRDSGNALLQAEQHLMESDAFKTTVVRFGGLYGGGRHPANYLAGKKNLSRANAPVNLIHREDCIAIITQIIEEQITDEIFNAVADDHPTRKEYYSNIAQKMGLEPPDFKLDDRIRDYKIVSNAKLKGMLSYNFIHPNLREDA